MVYCPVDGFQCADGFRFCPQCGTQLPQLTQPAAVRVAAASSPAQSAQPPLPQQPSPLPQHSPQQQQGSSYGYSSAGAQAQPPTNAVLVGPYGEKTDTFRKYADAIFDAIDAAVEPKRTGWLEFDKLQYWERIASASGTAEMAAQDLLFDAYKQFGIDCHMVPLLRNGRPDAGGARQLAISRDGMHQWLLFECKREPDDSFAELMRTIAALGLSAALPLHRGMLPLQGDAACQALRDRVEQGFAERNKTAAAIANAQQMAAIERAAQAQQLTAATTRMATASMLRSMESCDMMNSI